MGSDQRKPVLRHSTQKILRVRERLTCTQFHSQGQLIASQDDMNGNLYFSDGKEYIVSGGYGGLLETQVYAKDSCRIVAILDWHYEEVQASSRWSLSRSGDNGTLKYYKSMKTTVPAHSETPLDGVNEKVIVCNNCVYQTRRKRMLFSFERRFSNAYVFVWRMKRSHIPGCSRFESESDLTLTEQVFLAALSMGWGA